MAHAVLGQRSELCGALQFLALTRLRKASAFYSEVGASVIHVFSANPNLAHEFSPQWLLEQRLWPTPIHSRPAFCLQQGAP